MPEYIDPAVERLRERESDATVTLLLGVADEQAELIEAVEQTGGTVEDTIGRATLRVTAPEAAVDELCVLDGITSVELEREDVQTLDEGNASSRRRVTR